MKKHFYSHLVETDSLVIMINDLDVSSDEKAHLIALVDSQLHHTVLDAVLSELSEEDKRLFLKHLLDEDHDTIWNHLNTKVDNIEERIKKAADDLKKALHEDIKEAKSMKK
jgi:hypothetical protein